jgi:hypothetical protein
MLLVLSIFGHWNSVTYCSYLRVQYATNPECAVRKSSYSEPEGFYSSEEPQARVLQNQCRTHQLERSLEPYPRTIELPTSGKTNYQRTTSTFLVSVSFLFSPATFRRDVETGEGISNIVAKFIVSCRY